ncbi:MAG TPA: hypothetical protein VHH73_13445, partial [Verrucomicrobiae bacterium]|nr:hypothetical protein [Verrucomicrobiae bacterium]
MNNSVISRQVLTPGWLVVFALVLLPASLRADDFAVDLPPGVRVVWDASKAFREVTPARERICVNGLWRWQPANNTATTVPSGQWGFFKAPGCWPGITDYMQKDSQTLYAHPAWNGTKLAEVRAAWYEREITVPANWAGRKISLSLEYLNSYAAVYVDGTRAGEIHFPGGELDLTSACRPGVTQRLSLLVVALPLKGVMLSYTDSASAREVKGTVARRGLCGDLFLASVPAGPKITEVNVDTSVRRRELAIRAKTSGLAPGSLYRLRARITKDGARETSFTGPVFHGADLKDGETTLGEKWMPKDLWDLHTPQNVHELSLSLEDDRGKILDTAWTQRFGFREFWIDGRDFYLNGSRLFLSAVPLDNALVGASLATYAATRESLARLKSFGINYVYAHNYGCEPGAHLSYAEILRAADDAGMLVGLTQPHFSHYEWNAPGADETNGYARHAAFYTGVAGNHPSVVMHVMSHNATGYEEDMNPEMIDGIHDERDQWAARNVKLATRAETIVRRLDPRRIVYHHASGSLGVMHDSNFYPNFAPSQELDDWFGHWATNGIKPVFTCEYGAPFTWDWTMYRGWYQGQREWGSAKVPWEFCLAEWNAEFFGDRAYQISEPLKQDLRWEAKQFRAGNTWHRWDYPNQVGSDRFAERYPVFARYITDNWRSFRSWGVSGTSPWEYEHFWKLREGVDRRRKDLPVDWDNLQRPGFSPVFLDQQFERMDTAFEREDWIATPAAEALIRNNRPLLACIAGKPSAFTSKDHNLLPGEVVEKQIIVINNSRAKVTCEVDWSCDLPRAVSGKQKVTLAAGEQARVQVRIALPDTLVIGRREIRLIAKFSTGETQEDRFGFDVMSPPASVGMMKPGRIAVFDPKGETTAELAKFGVGGDAVGANADLAGYDVLVVGKAALTPDGAAPDIARVRDGLKVLMFEQTADVLEKRFGFRVQERGLRQVFARVPDHPALAGIRLENLHDWRGAATILPPQLKYQMRPRYGPTIQWAGIPVTRVWRCGTRGNVASVLIEKPARGDFLPVIDGGFSLQYSPLLEYHEGRGMVLFCQLDVTGRSESDPAARALLGNLLRHLAAWKPSPRRDVVYAGSAEGRQWLQSTGLNPRGLEAGSPRTNEVLVLGPGGG